MGRKIAPLHVIQEDKKIWEDKKKKKIWEDKNTKWEWQNERNKEKRRRGSENHPNKASFLQPWPRKRTQSRSRTREWQNPGTTFKSGLTTMGKSWSIWGLGCCCRRCSCCCLSHPSAFPLQSPHFPSAPTLTSLASMSVTQIVYSRHHHVRKRHSGCLAHRAPTYL